MTRNEFLAADPLLKLEYIDSEDIYCLFSHGHYDGPASGVVLYKCEKYWAHCRYIDEYPRIFLMCKISEEDAKFMEEKSKNWATCSDEERTAYSKKGLEIERKLDSTEPIIGYFTDWVDRRK